MFDNQRILAPIDGSDISSLPSEVDFDPFGGDLDARSAWRSFGGLTLDEAYVRFCDDPEDKQEDFMFMGCRAFHFYFPVIEGYLRTFTSTGEGDDCQAKILAQCIAAQFDWRGAAISPALRDRISQLCAFVRTHLDRYTQLPADQKEIDCVWFEIEGKL